MKRIAITSALAASAMVGAFVLPATAAADTPSKSDPLAGKTVFLDPGHQQSADGHDMTKQVDDGYGGTKNCQTSGMTTLGGTPEYEITYDVATIVKGALEGLGADVEMSRGETGWGGCITDRAEKANASGADVAVSIHADSTSGGKDTVNHGFHFIEPVLDGITDAQAKNAQADGGRAFTESMRDTFEDRGYTPSNYMGEDGIVLRDDIAGPALTEVPLAFVELGNGSNPQDAKKLDGVEGRGDYAAAIAVGITEYLLGAGDGAAADQAAGQAAGAAESGADAGRSGNSGKSAGTGESGDAGVSGDALAGTGIGDVLDQLDGVLDLFDRAARVEGLDGLLDLINDGNIAKIEDLADSVLGAAQPALGRAAQLAGN